MSSDGGAVVSTARRPQTDGPFYSITNIHLRAEVMERNRTAELMPIVWRLGTARGYSESARRVDLARLRAEHGGDRWHRSAVAEWLAARLDDHCGVVRAGAAIALGHVAAGVLSEELAALAADGEDLSGYSAGIDQAVSAAGEGFSGSAGTRGAAVAQSEEASTGEGGYDRLVQLVTATRNRLRAPGLRGAPAFAQDTSAV